MRSKVISSILVSASMMSAVPAMAATSASSLSVVGARAGAPASGESDLAGGGGAMIGLAIAAGVIAILVVGLVVSNDDNDETPASA